MKKTEKRNKGKKYRNENWLREQIENKWREQKDIANECEVSTQTISYWANKFDINTSHKITKTCKECGKEFETHQCEIKQGKGKFCSLSCARKYDHRKERQRKEDEARDKPLSWNKRIAYLSGLITSDGSLANDIPRIRFWSKDKSLIDQVQEIAKIELDIDNCNPYQNQDGIWGYGFISRKFYYFLQSMGLMPNKTKKLGKLKIPDSLFLSWLRGEIDGDGCFSRRQRENSPLLLSITSSSHILLQWISNILENRKLVKGQGNVVSDHSSYRIEYFHHDTKTIAKAIYKDADYYLKRKYDVVKEFIDPINNS